MEYKRDGEGTLSFENGDVYSGCWQGDHFHGHGLMKYATGSTYEGAWFESEYCGFGKFTTPEGCIYDGSFIQNKFNGHGRMTYPNGDSYEGEWRHDMKWGYGCLSFADGRKSTTGYWEKGQYKSEVNYLLPEKCPPKAAKILGVEFVPQRSECKSPEVPCAEEVEHAYIESADSWRSASVTRARVRPQFYGRGGTSEQLFPTYPDPQCCSEADDSRYDKDKENHTTDFSQNKDSGYDDDTLAKTSAAASTTEFSYESNFCLSPGPGAWDLADLGRVEDVDGDVKGIVGGVAWS